MPIGIMTPEIMFFEAIEASEEPDLRLIHFLLDRNDVPHQKHPGNMWRDKTNKTNRPNKGTDNAASKLIRNREERRSCCA